MNAHTEGQHCDHEVTIERVGDTVIVDIPGNGSHYELQLNTAMAIRIGSAIVRAASDEYHDSLADDYLDRAITVMESEAGEQA